MRLRSQLKSAGWDMTPMIDVVFLLIVFFTLVLNFAVADQNDRIKLPVSELAQPPEQPPTEPITLHVLANGSIIYNGEELPLAKLKESIDHQLRILKFMNTPMEKATVIIRADAQCKSGHVFDVMELCNNANLTRIVLRTKQKEGEEGKNLTKNGLE
jgi:biopolymer transport protein ExbD